MKKGPDPYPPEMLLDVLLLWHFVFKSRLVYVGV